MFELIKNNYLFLSLAIVFIYMYKNFYLKKSKEKKILISVFFLNMFIYTCSLINVSYINYLYIIPLILLSSFSLNKIKSIFIFNIFFIIVLIMKNTELYAFYILLLTIVELTNYFKCYHTTSKIKIYLYIILFISSIFNELYMGFIIFSFLFYFSLLEEYYMKDELTNTMNRKLFMKDLKSRKTSITAIISIDLNGLKKINDTYGHEEGDKAIITLVNIIKLRINNNMKLYRIGGDEFNIICYNLYKKDIMETIENIKKDLEKTSYSCAIGVSYKESDISITQMINLADELMYKDKDYYKSVR